MTGSKVVLDTWAWWEILEGTPEGVALARRYLGGPRSQVLTSAITLGELSARIGPRLGEEDLQRVWNLLHASSTWVEVSAELAFRAGRLRAGLRERDKHASLADAIVLETARSQGALLVSGDPAFEGLAGVRRR